MGRNKDAGPPAQWHVETTIQFCNLCIIEIQKGNRPTTHFNKEGWTNIVKGFSDITSRLYDKLQLKNKWDQLKKEWKLWRELKHGSTGLRWDPLKNTIMASDEWWVEKLKVIPAAKKYRSNGISPELEEKLAIMFTDIVATGDYAWTPNSGQPPPELREELRAPEVMDDTEHLDSSSGSKRSANSQPKINLKKKNKVGVAHKLVDKLDQLIEATSMSAVSSTSQRMISSADATAKAIKIIDSLGEVVKDDNFYWFAIDLIQQKEKRNVFINLNNDKKLMFLKREYDKTLH